MKAWAVLIAAVAFVVSPLVTEGFAGFEPNQFPIPQDDAPVQPAGYAFSIWSVIYLWLLVSAVIGVWKHRDDPAWDAARVPLVLSLAVGAFWIKVATLSVIWATVLIWIMLVTAIWALIAGRNIKPAWEFALPTGLYAGWLTAASCVSIGLLGAGYGIAAGAVVWALAMIAVALVLGVVVQKQAFGIWTYAFAVAWALVGIIVSNGTQTLSVSLFALAGIVVISGLALRQLRSAA
ncbi:tryptophan-rich sensory protein [Litoreibacter arenae]|uniref:Tryptophan-rich sensory protein n=1 Tax=Litoreibacter arenae DSM 19593 TaxID=1123360 RepID=S9QK66_9RHOB|nr:tryptophan-rich sensory protein [Litoreibacter arenae]EPX79983.1 hypothetical protein thalar_01319 [Litoreibacter arenae DSM 19593]